MNLGQLAVRGVVGPLFAAHGAQKLFGWFDGHGLEGTGGFFESLGLKPGRRHALAAGLAETGGGAMLTLGAFTPVASAAISGTMVTAIRKAHAANGPWSAQGGYEYNAVLLASLFALTEAGPGKPSVDEVRFPWMKGPAFAVLQLAAGVAGSYLATSFFNEAEQGQAPQEGATDQPGDPATADEAPPAIDDEHTEFGRFKRPVDGPSVLETETSGTTTST